MWKLGLTGSIASGKSTALREFEALGVPTFSSDEAVHALYRGEAVPVVEGVQTPLGPTGVGHFATSDAGTLLYLPGPAGGPTGDRMIAAADGAGRVERLAPPSGPTGTSCDSISRHAGNCSRVAGRPKAQAASRTGGGARPSDSE